MMDKVSNGSSSDEKVKISFLIETFFKLSGSTRWFVGISSIVLGAIPSFMMFIYPEIKKETTTIDPSFLADLEPYLIIFVGYAIVLYTLYWALKNYAYANFFRHDILSQLNTPISSLNSNNLLLQQSAKEINTQTIPRLEEIVNGALVASNMDTFISNPKKYSKIIDEIELTHHINICGTMAGFSFTIVDAIARHVNKKGVDFNKIAIYSPDKVDNSTGAGIPVAVYSIYFATRLVIRILKQTEQYKKPLNFSMMINYMDFGIFSAAVHFEKKECLVLQALSMEALKSALKGDAGSSLNGMRFSNSEQNGYFQQIVDTFNEYSDVSDESRVEKWTITYDENESTTIVIENPHWRCDLDSDLSFKIINSEVSPNIDKAFSSREEAIKFMNKLQESIYNQGNTDLREIARCWNSLND